MEYLNAFLAIVGTIMGLASFTEKFGRWRPYLLPTSTALLGIMAGYLIANMSKSNIQFTADDVLKNLGYLFVAALLLSMMYMISIYRDHGIGFFF